MDKSKNLPKVWGKGPIKIGDVELDCYILEDGSPIFSHRKLMAALGRKWKGVDDKRGNKPSFINANNLQPFVRPELEKALEGVEFLDGARVASGFPATILPMVCRVYWEAGRAGVLTPSQMPTAEKCEILTHAFSMVGITALIYEQLGYEKMKHPEAFRMLVDSYLEEEFRRWSKEFPDEFFFQLDRIYQNQPSTNGKRPQYYAKFIRKYIYEPILDGAILRELDLRNPKNEKGNRKHKHHTLTSEKIGLPAIRAQIWQVIAALKMSSNKRVYESNYSRLVGNTVQKDLFEDVGD